MKKTGNVPSLWDIPSEGCDGKVLSSDFMGYLCGPHLVTFSFVILSESFNTPLLTPSFPSKKRRMAAACNAATAAQKRARASRGSVNACFPGSVISVLKSVQKGWLVVSPSSLSDGLELGVLAGLTVFQDQLRSRLPLQLSPHM